MYTFLTGLQVVVILITFIALGLLLNGDGSRAQKLMSLFVTGSIVLNVGYLLEITATTLEAAVVATKMQYLGVTFIPILYCWFMFQYCYEKVPIRLIQIILIADLLMLGAVFTSEYHTFFFRKIELVREEGTRSYLDISYGPGYAVFFLVAYMLPYIMSLYALIHASITSPNRIQAKLYPDLPVSHSGAFYLHMETVSALRLYAGRAGRSAFFGGHYSVEPPEL